MAPNNPLSCHGNDKTMNLNTMLLTNIQASPYFKVNLYELKTYHEVIDEIYYKVTHLEPWEKGSRKTAGQTGMCGGVRGVGAGGIVSSAFCLLYKLFTLKLTRKQVMGLLNHTDSPYIRALGFMYIRYTQPPGELWEWYEEYLTDEEEVDVRAGGGQTMTMGELIRLLLIKLEWYSTLFPRIPVPIQKQIQAKLKEHDAEMRQHQPEPQPTDETPDEPHDRMDGSQGRDSPEHSRDQRPRRSRSRDRKRRSRSRDGRHRSRSKEGKRRSRSRDGRRRSRSRDGKRRSRSRDGRRRSRSRDGRRRSRSRDGRRRSRSRDGRRRSRSREGRRRSKSRDGRRRSRSRNGRHRSEERSHKSRSRSRDRRRRSRDRKTKGREHKRESSFERDLRREKDRIDKHYNGK